MIMKPGYLRTRFHSLLTYELQKLYESLAVGKDYNIIVEVQPQIGKSTTCSELFPAWVLGKSALDFGLGWPVICASYGADLAERKSQNCRDIIESENYRLVFPDTRLRQDSTSKSFWQTTTGGSYRAVGVGGGLTGMPGKLLIGDDLIKDRADAESEVVREGTWKWWQTVFMTRRQTGSGICLVNTRWHMQDVSGMVRAQFERDEASGKKKWEYDQWKTFTFPAFALEDEYIAGRLFRKVGDVLCPERFTREDMVRRRNATDHYEWSALFMQTPILKENAKFRTEWFKYYTPNDIKFKKLRTYTLVDPAGRKKKSDNTVIRTVGKEMTTGFIFLLEETAGRMDPGQTIDAVFHHVRTWHSRVWVESVAYQETLLYWMTEKQREAQFFFEVNELKQSKDKNGRIEQLIGPYKAGIIFHTPADRDYELELLSFPQGKNDDRIDAVAMFLQVAETTATSESPEQRQQRKREEQEDFDAHASISRV